MTSAGDSREQRKAESVMLEELQSRLGLQLDKRRFTLSGGTWLEVDGVCDDPLTLVEAWAHQGSPKSAQKNKVVADAFKLLFVEGVLARPARKILLLASDDAAAFFVGSSWMAHALRAKGIEVVVVDLPPELRQEVRDAQERQFR